MEDLGRRIRERRKVLGLTLRDLSAKLGISPSTLHKIEKGIISPTIALMIDISHHLEEPLYSLVKEDKNNFMHFKKDEQKVLREKDIKVRLIADYGLLDENISFSIFNVKEGAKLKKHTEPFHTFVYVIEGKIIIEMEGTSNLVGAGEAAYFDGTCPHNTRALTDAHLVNIYIRDVE